MREPDLCWWDDPLPCLAARDMFLGCWRGFVGLGNDHSYHGRELPELLRIEGGLDVLTSAYGGVCWAGFLPEKCNEHSDRLWWLGIETNHGEDVMPLLKLDAAISGGRTYKDLHFVRREVNGLARKLVGVK